MHTGAGMEEEDNLRNENKARVPARHPTKHVCVRPTPQASIVIGRQPLAFTAAGLRPRTSPLHIRPPSSPFTQSTMSVNRQLVVFDFDWSLADQDSDRWIFEVLAPDLRRKMRQDKDTVQWTDSV